MVGGVLIRHGVLSRIAVCPCIQNALSREIADGKRITIIVDRIHYQMQRHDILAVMMRGVHMRHRFADRVVRACSIQVSIIPEERISLRDMNRRVLMYRIGSHYNPACYTVASICPVVMNRSVVHRILPRGNGRNRVFVDARTVDPFVAIRQEELNRVALTETIRIFRNMCLVRTNDDMMGIAAVTVIHNRVTMIAYTFPFALPLTGVLTTVGCREGRINQVTQNHRIRLNLFFAGEGGVGPGETRNNAEGEVDYRVTSASGLVGMRIEIFRPYLFRILTT